MNIPGQPILVVEESWEEPARILARRLVELAPRHTWRWIQRGEMGSRGSSAFIEQFARILPDIAWDETKAHYAAFWEQFDEGYFLAIPDFANAVFFAFEKLDDSPARKFLLEEPYSKEPYAKVLQNDAMMGMLRAAESAEDFVSFLDWRLEAGKELSEKISGYRFSVDPGVMRITALGLSLFAKAEPRQAIQWASANREALDFDWHYAVYGGWVEFWAENPEDVQAYLNRRTEAFGWLVDHVEPDSATIHNAFLKWRSANHKEAIGWLNRATDHKRERAVKQALIAEEPMWPQE